MEGAKALAETVRANGTLVSLALSDNYVGAEGGAALAAALEDNTSLRELRIKGNELGDAGLEALCDALVVRKEGGRAFFWLCVCVARVCLCVHCASLFCAAPRTANTPPVRRSSQKNTTTTPN